MNLYAIFRRDGFVDGSALEEAAARSTKVGDEMSNDIRWIRSYVLDEGGGALGTVCIYEASSEEAIRKHAESFDVQAFKRKIKDSIEGEWKQFQK